MMRVPDFVPSPELYPFTSRWLDTSGGRLHYVDEGAGRPVLLLHGNPTWSFLYRQLILALTDPDAECVIVAVHTGNIGSWRALEKAA
jgi:pimeloyl-ACP methyl ester carboxylesterase